MAWRNADADRARMLGLKAWLALQLRGVGPELWQIAREAEKLAPSSPHTRSLIETIKRIEADRTAKKTGEGDA